MTDTVLAIIDDTTGTLLVPSDSDLDRAVQQELSETLGKPERTGCALSGVRSSTAVARVPGSVQTGIRISGFWHDSLIEGPGRRSVVRMQGCPIRCPGCWVPETHDPDGGHDVPIDVMTDHLLNPGWQRDGVTILGGEPFAQPAALHCLIAEMKGRQPDLHVLVYTGYTFESLLRRAQMPTQPPFDNVAADILGVLHLADMLIDGPYVRALAHSEHCSCADEARLWSGSCNQRLRQLQ